MGQGERQEFALGDPLSWMDQGVLEAFKHEAAHGIRRRCGW
jgi:hypothetical protein